MNWTDYALILCLILWVALWLRESRLSKAFRTTTRRDGGSATSIDPDATTRLLASFRVRSARDSLFSVLLVVVAVVGGVWPLALLALLPLTTAVLRLALVRKAQLQMDARG